MLKTFILWFPGKIIVQGFVNMPYVSDVSITNLEFVNILFAIVYGNWVYTIYIFAPVLRYISETLQPGNTSHTRRLQKDPNEISYLNLPWQYAFVKTTGALEPFMARMNLITK